VIVTLRFSNQLLAELVQPFWAALQAGEFLTDAAGQAGTHRWRGWPNEGASKGILVTTDGFGKAAYEFAKNKPLELIRDSNLLYLLKVHADVDAKIEPPEHWVNPKTDIGPHHGHEPTSDKAQHD
jgi:hypothetical protein